MTGATPKTIVQQMDDEIGDLLFSLPRYLDGDHEVAIAWRDKAEIAMRAGRRSMAFLGFSMVAHLCGDKDEIESYLERAETAGVSAIEISGRRAMAYSNLGFASKAMIEIKGLVSARSLSIVEGLPFAIASGAFGQAKELLERAALTGIDLSAVMQIGQIKQVVKGVAMTGITDEQCAQVMDLAGAVMREHKLFWLEKSPRISFDHEMGCVGIRYRVGVTPEEATALTAEFTDRLIDADLYQLPITVGFVGVVESTAVTA